MSGGPPASTPPVSRLTTDAVLLAAALESGRGAVNAVFRGASGSGTTEAGRLLIQVTAAHDGVTIMRKRRMLGG